MCGIVGVISKKPVANTLLEGLKRLEYRGYDSAGIATLERGKLARLRSEGKLVNLQDKLQNHPLAGHIGIGHTRWATHGRAVERNAHPQMTEEVAVVHNGIIENFVALRAQLQAESCVFESETDTEVLVHLLSKFVKAGATSLQAVQKALQEIKGAYALAILFRAEEDKIFVARSGAPLAIGYGTNEMFVASDAVALAPFTRKISYLENGDYGVVTRQGVEIYNAAGAAVERKILVSGAERFLVSKENYRHFMQKEIYEQPEAVARTASYYMDFDQLQFHPIEGEPDWKNLSNLVLSGCGTAFYACLTAKYWFESLANLVVETDIASEMRYRHFIAEANRAALFVSQSGETADTLACLAEYKRRGVVTSCLVNVEESSMSRMAKFVFPTLAGPEIGVASTKAFTSQLVALLCLALRAAEAKGTLAPQEKHAFGKEIASLPHYMHEVLQLDKKILELANRLLSAKHALYLGRGTSYPIALEGALKLKELSYIHAEGYAAGELKHGPIALVDEEMPVVVVAPYDRWFEKTISNMQEVIARGGKVICLTDKRGQKLAQGENVTLLLLPEVPASLTPIVYTLPLQLLAYHTAVLRGTDVDQPRNLAKSVTVE